MQQQHRVPQAAHCPPLLCGPGHGPCSPQCQPLSMQHHCEGSDHLGKGHHLLSLAPSEGHAVQDHLTHRLSYLVICPHLSLATHLHTALAVGPSDWRRKALHTKFSQKPHGLERTRPRSQQGFPQDTPTRTLGAPLGSMHGHVRPSRPDSALAPVSARLPLGQA